MWTFWSLVPHLHLAVHAQELQEAHPILDAGALRKILADLLENAIRHAKSEIWASVEISGGTLELAVADGGPWLRAGMEERAFEPVVTLDARAGRGSGSRLRASWRLPTAGTSSTKAGRSRLRLPGGEAKS